MPKIIFKLKDGSEKIVDAPNGLSVMEVALKNKNLLSIVLRCATTMNNQPWTYDLWLLQKKGDPKKMCAIEFAHPRGAKVGGISVESMLEGFEIN